MKFKIGTQICLKVDNSITGVIIEIININEKLSKYKVFHGNMNIQEYYEEQIKVLNEEKFNYLDKDTFLESYILKKLKLNNLETVYSLNSGKIKFIPFQFRPLSRILKSENNRILIADEVGVGKTIETGIIIKEFEKREDIRSIMIICPKDLTSKWKRELKVKFDESFEILTSDRLRYCIKEVEMEGEWATECRKCIIGLELLRREENLELLRKLEEIISFDMIIVDEAHHITNPNSKSHEVVKYFCENSKSIVFLSATPLQLETLDLFYLLNLLEPNEFIDENLFYQMIEPNKYINGSIRFIRNTSCDDWQEKAYQELLNIYNNSWAKEAFFNNSILNYWLNRLKNSKVSLTDEERISCISDLERLHTLSHIINRTKRKDIGEFTIREPITVSTDFSTLEREFYNKVIEFRKGLFSLKYNKNIINFIMTTIERQITSCLPAFIDLLEEFIKKGVKSLYNISDDIDIENIDELLNKTNLNLEEKIEELKVLSKQLPKVDAKFNNLVKVLTEAKKNKDGKILVFSFFKTTLSYLYTNLKKLGYNVALITGETPFYEREIIRNNFRLENTNSEAIEILLCSEVGCEGLDYEFCNKLINYDIPWNPMKIEQRIGRIDRFGQKSPKVQIYNFIIPNTVEEKVFFRCYDRLGIFNSTVGDLEDILGEVVPELSKQALEYNLTEEQQQRKIKQISDNAIRKVFEQREFEKNSKDLFLLDLKTKENNIIEEKNIYIKLLEELVKCFFNICLEGSSIKEIDKDIFKIRLSKQDKQFLIKELTIIKKGIDRNSEALNLLEKYLLSESSTINLYFNYENSKKLEESLFIDINHPLLKIILKILSEERGEIITNLRLKVDNIIEKGKYLFFCYHWKEIGYRKQEYIDIVLYNLENNEIKNIDLINFEKLLLIAENNEIKHNINEEFREDISNIEKYIFEKHRKKKEKLTLFNNELVYKKLSSLNNYYDHQIKKIENDLLIIDNKKIKVMKKSQLERTISTWKKKKGELEEKLRTDIIVNLFAKGYLEGR